MLLVSYDISNDKLRTKFSKFLRKFGYRLQYSLYQIRNSDRALANILTKIENYFSKYFKETDSILIFNLTQNCKIIKYGYASHDEEDLIII